MAQFKVKVRVIKYLEFTFDTEDWPDIKTQDDACDTALDLIERGDEEEAEHVEKTANREIIEN